MLVRNNGFALTSLKSEKVVSKTVSLLEIPHILYGRLFNMNLIFDTVSILCNKG